MHVHIAVLGRWLQPIYNQPLACHAQSQVAPEADNYNSRVANLVQTLIEPDTTIDVVFSPYIPKSIDLSKSHTDAFLSEQIEIEATREAVIAEAIGCWNFSAHEFDQDELLHAAFLMFQHAFSMPELEEWSIPAGEFFCGGLGHELGDASTQPN